MFTTSSPSVCSFSECIPRTLQVSEAPRAFNNIAGQDVAQHRCLAGTGRSVDPHQPTCIRQIIQGPVDGELLTQRQAVLRIGGPPTFRQPVNPDSGVGNGVVPDDVLPPPYGKVGVGGQVLRQCRRAVPIRYPRHDSCKILKEETVEKVDVGSSIVGTTTGYSHR
jgi:hypothetical protein